jgi:hypothetical protein
MSWKESEGKDQGRVASSISNVRLGGIQEGWMGDRSVAVTWVSGWVSAKSLGGWSQG